MKEGQSGLQIMSEHLCYSGKIDASIIDNPRPTNNSSDSVKRLRYKALKCDHSDWNTATLFRDLLLHQANAVPFHDVTYLKQI
jgi:hypothetical protein